MTVLDPKGKSKKERKVINVVFFLVLIAFAIGAFVTTQNQTFTTHYATDDMNQLFYAFSALSHGDANGFVDGLFGGLPIIGLFLVLFTVLYFLFSVTLGKLFNSSKGIPITLALVMTIYGFINNKIYNYMISLNAFTIAFVVFCAVLIMIWGLTSRGMESYRRESEALRREIHAKRARGEDPLEEIKRLRHNLREMDKLHRKERKEQMERHQGHQYH